MHTKGGADDAHRKGINDAWGWLACMHTAWLQCMLPGWLVQGASSSGQRWRSSAAATTSRTEREGQVAATTA